MQYGATREWSRRPRSSSRSTFNVQRSTLTSSSSTSTVLLWSCSCPGLPHALFPRRIRIRSGGGSASVRCFCKSHVSPHPLRQLPTLLTTTTRLAGMLRLDFTRCIPQPTACRDGSARARMVPQRRQRRRHGDLHLRQPVDDVHLPTHHQQPSRDAPQPAHRHGTGPNAELRHHLHHHHLDLRARCYRSQRVPHPHPHADPDRHGLRLDHVAHGVPDVARG